MLNSSILYRIYPLRTILRKFELENAVFIRKNSKFKRKHHNTDLYGRIW